MVPMPAAVVVIACKVVFLPYASPVDEANAAYTQYRPYEYATEHSQLQCRRHEVQLYNPGIPNAPFTPQACMRASLQVRMEWDRANASRPWRVWKTGCPVPIVDTRTGSILSWKLPECPRVYRKGEDEIATVHCEVDAAI